jgi:hypothetical protein
MDQQEVEEYGSNPKKGFKSDHLSFYMDWSQMLVSCYEESHAFFTFYTASGKMNSMLQWSDRRVANPDHSDMNVAKIVACIWKLVHLPSHFYFCQKKIETSPNLDQNGYNTLSLHRM